MQAALETTFSKVEYGDFEWPLEWATPVNLKNKSPIEGDQQSYKRALGLWRQPICTYALSKQ
ncbi:hypothetical protein E2562_025471, partial [Oryza meyeriana var. granulata]